MLDSFSKLLGHNYKPLNRIEISRSALKHNYVYLNSLDKKIKIAPVLKSNAYGHGITLIAKELDSYNSPLFCVDSLYEAYELLKIRIKTPILIMGYFNPKSLQTKRLPFSFAVFTKEQVISINKYQPQAKIHIFVDTGMHREGIPINELEDYLFFIKSKTNLKIEGLMSHLAMSENPKILNTKRQIKTFKNALDIMNKNNIFPKWVHFANSSGTLNFNAYEDMLSNLSRTGLALYGIDPVGKNKKLMPILRLITRIIEIKEIQKGDYVGYNFSFKAKKDMKIAILPIGYNDGVDLRLSNLGCVKIGRKYCSIIGRVSMNITTIDVSNIENIHLGQEVVVYSRKKEDKNSIENVAKQIGTMPYEILVHLASSTKRVLV